MRAPKNSKILVKSLRQLRLKRTKPIDKTNITFSHRLLVDYKKHLELKNSIPALCKKLSEDLNRKISILDSGCGQAVADEELLKSRSLDSIISKITGVSMHHFSTIDPIVEKYSSRFSYYNATTQDFLSKFTKPQFDLILDVYGAYYYSLERPNLLRLYYESLKQGGVAYFRIQENDKLVLKKNKVLFHNYLVRKYPDIFTYMSDKVLKMSKLVTFPDSLTKFIESDNLVSTKLVPAAGFEDNKKHTYSLSDLKKKGMH